jgi:protein involved in polysaccharide export with SLBB domain
VLAAAALAWAIAPACGKRVPSPAPDAAKAAMPAEAKAPPAAEPTAPQQAPPQPAPPAAGRVVQAGRQTGPRIATYYLSGGDDIRVSVLGSPDLSRSFRIPPDGHIFFPMVGDIGVDGMSIPELRQILTERLRSADEQRIGTGDQIVVRVFRNDDLGITTTVPSSGKVNMPLAEEVELAGLTVEEANQAIAKKLLPYVVKPSVNTTILKSASGLPGRISDPQVTIEVIGFGGHKVLVLGEVKSPGVYLSEGGSRLMEMVARAGGPTKDAKLKQVALVRPATETTPARSVVVDLERAVKNGEPQLNPTVQRGDVIYVPKTTIAKMAQFFEQVYDIIRPFVLVETGIWLGQNIDAGPGRQNDSSIVFPPE